MENQKYNYGMVGLGTMGRNLAFNMCDHKYSVAGFDKNEKQVALFKEEGKDMQIFGTSDLTQFINALEEPRIIILLVPAGRVVDAVIGEFAPLLSENDILIDCGNSHFTDTNKRIAMLSDKHLHFMGVGVSGGEEGARYGPSIMPGGNEEVYKKIAPLFEAVSAKVNGEPCVTYLGAGSAGHYVKMVHNGIEYGLMQLISETYHLLKLNGGLSNSELHEVFNKWNKGKLNSFLIEITAEIFLQKDELTSSDLIDMILDTAQQKGTGKWASQDAMDLGTPVPVIDTSVTSRQLSGYKSERTTAAKILKGPEHLPMDKNELINTLEQALFFSMMVSYAQGMNLLYHASEEYKYNLQLEAVSKIWRGGCIIRSAFLETIRAAFAEAPGLVNLLLNEEVAKQLNDTQEDIRKVISLAVNSGVPVPAMMSALAYFDAYRREWLPTNLIQAQRDFFGAHTYQRTDRDGIFHTHWEIKNQENGIHN
jgi:6-phosphogluconate dehydrogenase